MIHSPPASLVWWQVYNEPNDDVLSLQKWWHDAFCLSRRIFWIVKVIVIFFRWSKKLHPEPFWGWGPVIIMISVVMILLPPSPRYGKYGKLKIASLPCSNIIWTLTMNAPILIPVSSSAANRLIGEVVQSRRRPRLGPSPGWKRLLPLSHLRHY